MKIIRSSKEDSLDYKVAVVVSRFNEAITSKLLEGALARFKEVGFPEKNLTVVHVPGAIEIPIAVQRLAELGTFEAIVALGAVIRGETSHYDYVCSQVSEGCQHVSLQNNVPVIFGVLTTENEDQARDRIGGKEGHKGSEAAEVALEIISVLRQIE